MRGSSLAPSSSPRSFFRRGYSSAAARRFSLSAAGRFCFAGGWA